MNSKVTKATKGDAIKRIVPSIDVIFEGRVVGLERGMFNNLFNSYETLIALYALMRVYSSLQANMPCYRGAAYSDRNRSERFNALNASLNASLLTSKVLRLRPDAPVFHSMFFQF